MFDSLNPPCQVNSGVPTDFPLLIYIILIPHLLYAVHILHLEGLVGNKPHKLKCKTI